MINIYANRKDGNKLKEWFGIHKTKLASALALVMIFIVYLYFKPSEDPLILSEGSPLVPQTQMRSTSAEVDEEEATIMMVDVKGAIKIPGVYVAEKGERVIDLITKAGGFLPEADQDQVNLSQHVADEMVIFVPIQGENLESMASGSTHVQQNQGLVNINKASESELQTLPGIGPAKATAIIEYRETNSGFKTIEDLKKISGIGEKTFEKLESLISVK
jgi:competence protein ComEA